MSEANQFTEAKLTIYHNNPYKYLSHQNIMEKAEKLEKLISLLMKPNVLHDAFIEFQDNHINFRIHTLDIKTTTFKVIYVKSDFALIGSETLPLLLHPYGTNIGYEPV